MHFHQQIHEYLLTYRKKYNPNFNFLVRQRASENDKNYPGSKFAHGIVFQGNDSYCSVGLIDKGAGNNSTRSVGLLFKPIEDGFNISLHIIFKKEKNEKIIEFYKALASIFKNTKWNTEVDALIPICKMKKDDPTELYEWLDEYYPKIRKLALETGIKKLIPDDNKYDKLQSRLEEKLIESTVPLNYWIFQGNPKIYDFESALSDNSLQDFTVSSHKDKIKVGDKVIIWLTGKQSGCYALAEITSEPSLQSERSNDKHWKKDNSNDLKAGIKITHNLYDNPILWENIKDRDTFKDFKAGNQGSNFTATKEEYSIFKKMLQNNNKQYWLYAPGESAKYWEEFYEEGVMGLGWNELGDLTKYQDKSAIRKAIQNTYSEEGEKMNDTLANFEFSNKIQIGDIVIAKKGKTEYLGYGIVTSDYYYDEESDGFKSFRKVNWRKKGLWQDEGIVLKTLTNITKYPEYVNKLIELIGIEEDKNTTMNDTQLPLNQILFGPPGTGKTFKLQSEYFKRFTQYSASTSRENYLKEEVEPLAWWQVLYIALLDLGKVRVNDILAHPAVQAKAKLSTINNLRASLWGALQRHTAEDCPNVGVLSRAAIKPFWKTDHSEWHIQEDENLELFPEAQQILETYKYYDETNSKEIENYSFVTFHQSFTYEDFVEGIKPVLDDETDDIKYEISNGIFKKLALKAQDDPDNDYAIFIDEINRGNVASIFGELITLIEKDKRQGAENELSVILPYSKTKFSVPQNLHIIGTMNTADRSVEALDTALRRRFSFIEMPPIPGVILSNGKADAGMVEGIELPFLLQTINKRIEKLLDKDHKIGHSYFLNVESVEDLRKVFRDKVIPLLEEYFFGDYGKIGLVLGNTFIRKTENNEIRFASFDDYDESIVSDLNQREVYEMKPMDTWDFKSIYL